MSDSWNNVKTVCCKPWLVLPTVYSDALSYGEQLDKFCYSLNKLIENNNILPDYIAELIKEYISSGAIDEVVREILANYILNVKYPPNGITPAVGDGSADDTEALQGCIDYAADNGGVVYFPYGSYLTQPLTMKDGVSLFGFDRYSTKIVLKGGATKALLNGNTSGLSVCNLTLDGNSGIQVNDVNVVDMTGSNLMFNDLVIKDGYKLFEFVGDGHLQVSNVVFGNAVENCFTVDGNVIVQTKNLLFTALSKVGGVSVIDIKANGGNYDFNSVAKCDTCMLISGNDNKVVAMIGGAAEDYVDTGNHNNVEIVGHSQKEYYSGNVKKDANNSETTLQGTRSLHVVGTSTVAYDSDSTESVDGNKTVNLINETKTVNGKEQLTANDISINANNTFSGNYQHIEEIVKENNWKITFPDKTVDLHDIHKTLVNVKDYGAIGDGVTDDTLAFKTALSSISNYSGLFIPKGTYLITEELTLKNGKNVIGEDKYNCVILVNGDITLFSYTGNADGFNGELANFHIKSVTGNSKGIYMDNTSRYYIHDILFTDLATCLTACRGGFCTIKNLYSQAEAFRAGNYKFGAFSGENVYSFVNSYISNIVAESSNGVVSPAFHFRYCVATKCYSLFAPVGDTTETGIQIDGDSQGLTFYGTMLTGLGEGVRIQSDADYPKNIIFIGCDIDQCKTPIIITAGEEIEFIGGAITSSAKFTNNFAIQATDVKTLKLTSMSIGGYYTANGGGVHLFGTTDGETTITDCNFHGNYYGVLIEENNKAVLKNNTFNDCESPIIGIDAIKGYNKADGNAGYTPWTLFNTPNEPTSKLTNVYGVPVNVVLHTDKYNSLKINEQVFANYTSGIISFMLEPSDTLEFTNPVSGSIFEWWWLFKQ